LFGISAVPPVTDIKNIPATTTVGAGVTLNPTVTPSSRSVEWEIVNAGTTNAIISGNTFVGLNPGVAIIRGRVNKGISATHNYVKDFTITVTEAIATNPVTDIILNKTSMILGVGETEKLTATVTPADATSTAITWTSNDSTVAEVDNNGNILAKKAGVTVITATATADNRSAFCMVVVTDGSIISVKDVSLDKTSVVLGVGATEQL
jgi:uncharacterized protein YjdB